MSEVWLIEDSSRQLQDLRSLLTKMGHSVHGFRGTDELLEHISDLPSPEAVLVDLALKGTNNGFQAAATILRMRPDVTAERFCFISGWKRQFTPFTPAEFRDTNIIDKGNWRLEDLQAALNRAINSQRAA